MPKKGKAISPHTDEPESKVAKVNGDMAPKGGSGFEANTIPDERTLMVEVQALLVGIDLATTTVGQLRKALETRLSLDAGALSASKSLRRKVGGVIQHEVVKKGLRNEDCERIAKALVEFENYPADARQMLIESLPHAVAPAGQMPHAHQVQLLAIVHNALDSARGQVADVLATGEECTREGEVELHRREKARGAAAEMEASANASVEESATHFNNAMREVQIAELDLSSAKTSLQKVREEVAKGQQAKLNAIALREGPLRLLLVDHVRENCQPQTAISGMASSASTLPRVETMPNCNEQQPADFGISAGSNRDDAISEVVQYLEATGADTALIASVRIMLQRPCSEHSPFDKKTLAWLDKLLGEHISGTEGQSATNTEVSLDASRLGAAALLNAARTRSAEQASAYMNAQTALEAATVAVQTADVGVSEQQVVVNERLADQARLEKKLQELDEILSTVNRLMTGGGSKTDEVVAEVVAEMTSATGSNDLENGSTDAVTVCEPINTMNAGLSDASVDSSVSHRNLMLTPLQESPCPSLVTLPVMSPNKMGAKKAEFDLFLPRFVTTPLSPNSRCAALATHALACK